MSRRRWLPPGVTETVPPATTLVVAPHYDDEVLGCGGLIAQLAAAGAAVRILFLSDGGGAEEGEARREYAARRRAESDAAVPRLGVSDVVYLERPDGRLAHHRAELASAIRDQLLDTGAELLLVPGPLEVTEDHQAAFAAAHEVLSTARRGQDLGAIVAGLTILLYEVNHPAYPDLLVDVSAELERIEAAMAEYPSQQARHDYLAAGLGLRRYRTHTLDPAVRGAEAYVRLSAEDFTTRSLADMVAYLGGSPQHPTVTAGPKISVVVRTCSRPRLLAEALASLAASHYRELEIVLVDDGGGQAGVPDGFPFPVVTVDHPERRGRAAAANSGVAAATGAYVAFLDDDDLVFPEHYAVLAGLVRGADVRVAYTDAAVGVYELDPEAGWREAERRLPYSRDFDPERLQVDNYIPLHTLLIDRRLLLDCGPFDPELPFFEDWDLLIRLAARATFHHHPQVTCEYRHFRGGGHVLGERPRERTDFLAMKAQVIGRYATARDPALLARVVDRLRAEAVEAGEAERSLRRDRDQARWALAAAEDRYHRTHGEASALRADVERLQGELGDQGELQRKLYAEIERLGGIIEAMQQTRAWRLHEWWQRRRS